MSWFALFAALITLTALLSYLNERFLRLPPAIGILAASLCLSVAWTLLGRWGGLPEAWVAGIIQKVDFSTVLLEGMLSFLLFAGALHVDLGDLLGRKWSILSLATCGVLMATILAGGLFYLLTAALGIEISLMWALVFGALISPTDPVSVLGVLRGARASRSLKSMIAGESLFNDGVGVVVFTLLFGLATTDARFSWVHASRLLVAEAAGGVVFGLALGYVAYRLLRGVDNSSVEILITIALVAGGYALAGALHTSGPITMVVAGLFMGNHGRFFGMSDQTRDHLDTFWKLIDEILNALLFVMIGLEMLVLDLDWLYLVVGVLAVFMVLAVRFVSVGLPISMLKLVKSFDPRTVSVMTWAGLRGGISIALALLLPASAQRDLILVSTYCVVVFSVLVQGLTLGRAVRWAMR